MSWFRRQSRPDPKPEPRPEPVRDPAAAAAEFWEGWRRLLPTVSAALGDGEQHRVENEMCDLVSGLHPDLHFVLERGQRAVYALVLSGQEDPKLRPYTDAWKAAAPPEDAIWEYHDSVPPVPDPTQVTVNLGQHRIPLVDIRVVAQVDEADGVVDVAVYHPKMADLDAAARSAMTFLPLDATLGERLAAQRLRRVETARTEPRNTIGLLELRQLVHDLASGEAGRPGRPG